MRQFTLLFLLLAVLQTHLLGQQSNGGTYSVLYTGRLLRYARVPNVQSLNGTPDPANSPVAEAYLNVFDTLEHGSSSLELRLAMGDNIAPDFEARTFRVSTAPPGKVCGRNWTLPASVRLPKDLFFRDEGAHMGWWLYCQDQKNEKSFSDDAFSDNAAAFLIRAKYDAAVAGKHDFFLGAEYLRRVGQYLEDNHVRMLGANIVVVTSRAPNQLNVSPRIPERLANDCHTNTGAHPCYHTDFGQASVDLPNDVLPFKQQFVIKNARRVMNPLTRELYRSDEVARLTANKVHYENLIDVRHTQICAEGDEQTRKDASMVLRLPRKCYPLRPAEEACKGNISGTLAPTCKSIYKSSSTGVFVEAEVDATLT
ncbi:MAG: hypothetical protein M3Y72_19115 [Acidobacteriota bacterium]|nr:hypothetical protein [Acidobacteriota bacterium]